MTFVLDASVALAWHFVEEGWEQAEALGVRALSEGVTVPSHFGMEIASVLLRGEREKRTSQAEIAAFISRLQMLAIDVVAPQDAFATLLPLARDTRLKPADAAYLDIALTRGLAIATFDTALRRAADEARVAVLEN